LSLNLAACGWRVPLHLSVCPLQPDLLIFLGFPWGERPGGRLA
jgi:hypothetical protein